MATTLDAIGGLGGRRSHGYYVGMAILFIVLIMIGFSESYYARLAGIDAVTPLVHVHAAVFAAWFVLLLAQTTLVSIDRRDLHRRLGIASVVLVPAVFGVGLATSFAAARAGWNPANVPGGVLGFFALGIIDTSLFAGFASAALLNRHRPELHKRLIVLASVSLLWAAISRLPIATGLATVGNAPPLVVLLGPFALLAALALSGPLYDFCTRQRVSRLEIAAGVLIVAGRPVARLVASSETLQAAALRWLG